MAPINFPDHVQFLELGLYCLTSMFSLWLFLCLDTLLHHTMVSPHRHILFLAICHDSVPCSRFTAWISFSFGHSWVLRSSASRIPSVKTGIMVHPCLNRHSVGKEGTSIEWERENLKHQRLPVSLGDCASLASIALAGR